MIRQILGALALAAFGGGLPVAAHAQERTPGHESAVGPGAHERAPGGPGPAMEPRGMAPPGGAFSPGAHPGPAQGQGRPNPNRAGVVPRVIAPVPQQVMPAAPQPQPQPQPHPQPQRVIPPAPEPRLPQNRPPVVVPPAVRSRPNPAQPLAPIDHAPRAYGAVPAPYRGNMHHFVDRDARVWRGGRWHHDRHGGRSGWWWVVGGLWYYYPQPVYPYPSPYVPGDVGFTSDGSASYWYYCVSAGQYYPYVTYCPEGWQAVVPDDDDSDD